MLDGCLCQKAGGCSIFKKDIFREKLLSFFFLFSTKRKKENQIVWINLFTLRLLWKETRSCQNLTKCFGWVLLFGFFFSTPQNYAVPSGVHCFAGMYQFQWKGFCMAHFCHLWSIFVTSERRCQIKKKKIFLIWKQTLSHNFICDVDMRGLDLFQHSAETHGKMNLSLFRKFNLEIIDLCQHGTYVAGHQHKHLFICMHHGRFLISF